MGSTRVNGPMVVSAMFRISRARASRWLRLVCLLAAVGGALSPFRAIAADRYIEFQHPLPPEINAIAGEYLRQLGYFEGSPISSNDGTAFLANDVYWAKADIDDDGVDEIFLSIRGEWCGTAGCDIVILQRILHGWRAICQTEGDKDRIELLDAKDEQYHEMILSAQPGKRPVHLKWVADDCFEYVPGQ
jgi:hypothetical protein